MLTTDERRFSIVPKVVTLECAVTTVPWTENVSTYRDIYKDPLRNTYLIRYKIWKPACRITCQTQ
jgi:hypothetical protein